MIVSLFLLYRLGKLVTTVALFPSRCACGARSPLIFAYNLTSYPEHPIGMAFALLHPAVFELSSSKGHPDGYSVYSILAGMLARETELDVVANNLANSQHSRF